MTEILIALVAGIGGLLSTIFKTFKFVKEGEKGCILRFGKLNRVRDPGFIIIIPWVEALETIHVRETTTELRPQKVILKDNYILHVSAVVVYKVVDARKAMYNIAHVDKAVGDIAMTVLRHQFAQLEYAGLNNFEEINQALLTDLCELTANWGVEFIHFRVSDLEPTPETAELLLLVGKAEKQAEANKLLLNDLMKQEKIIVDSRLPAIAYASWFPNSAMTTVAADPTPDHLA